MLHLRYHGTTTIPIEAECITPENLAGKTLAEIHALSVQVGNSRASLGDFFSSQGDPSDREIVLQGDCSRIKWLGAKMNSGRLTVEGNVGMHLGAEMRGGEIRVHGHAGDWVGAEMRGGHIHVRGDAGHLVGGAYRGSRLGMRGGVILVDGNAGTEVGCTMRRGLIAIGGASGAFPGVSMVAGSILLFGPSGGRIGAGMKRGTIALCGRQEELLATFSLACLYRPIFLDLYFRQLRAWGFPVADTLFQGRWQRFNGDLLALGKGELLQWMGAG